MKKIKLILAVVATLTTVFSQAQAPNARYVVCKRPAGQACNDASAPISCSFEYAPSDPCGLYTYYTVDPQGNRVALKCCSYPGGTIQGDQPYILEGHHFLPADSVYSILVNCNGNEGYEELYDFSNVVSGYSRPGVSFSNENDSLVVFIYDTDTVIPFIKNGTLVELKFAIEDIHDICELGMPAALFFNDLPIFKYPSLEYKLIENPIQNERLSLYFDNKEIIELINVIQVVDINGVVVSQLNKGQFRLNALDVLDLDLKGIANGLYFVVVATEIGVKSQKFVIQ